MIQKRTRVVLLLLASSLSRSMAQSPPPEPDRIGALEAQLATAQ